jgi:hypothetical protein
MPRGVVLLAALLLLMLIGVAVVAGLFRPNESDPTRALALFTAATRSAASRRSGRAAARPATPFRVSGKRRVGSVRRSSASPTASTLTACSRTRLTTSWPGSGTRPKSIRSRRCRRADWARRRPVASQPIYIPSTECTYSGTHTRGGALIGVTSVGGSARRLARRCRGCPMPTPRRSGDDAALAGAAGAAGAGCARTRPKAMVVIDGSPPPGRMLEPYMTSAPGAQPTKRSTVTQTPTLVIARSRSGGFHGFSSQLSGENS